MWTVLPILIETDNLVTYHNGNGADDIVADNIFTRRLVLLDDQNRAHIKLFIATDGSAYIVLNDLAERTLVVFRLERDGRHFGLQIYVGSSASSIAIRRGAAGPKRSTREA